MAETKYSFAKSCDGQRLTTEIQSSAIVTALDRIEGSTDLVDVWFKGALSSGDESLLSAIITSHVNTPLPSEVQTVTLTSNLVDPDTGGLTSSPKFAPTGWVQKIHEIEFETSKLNSIHDKDWELNDFGYGTLKFFDVNGGELTTQGAIDTDCVRTDFEWMPTHDYMIKGGLVSQLEVPTDNFYVWVQAVVLPSQYGGPLSTFCDGGLNMRFIGARDRVGLDGVAGTVLYYSHPQLGSGVGTNKLRFVCRHQPGVKHRIQAIFNIFSE